jgi:N-acetylneuraminic acid mutarotase
MIRAKLHSLNRKFTILLAWLLVAGLLGSAAVKAAGGSGTFALSGSLNTARYQHTATLLTNGNVLVTGGLGVNEYSDSLASAELYNPSTGKWAVTDTMSVGRTGHTATLLENGQVLVAGGSQYAVNCYDTAELYNPATGEWTLTGNMTQTRCYHSATLLPNGEVLVSGGVNSLYSTTDTNTIIASEIYNPATGTWTATGSLNVSRAESATILLKNGEVLTVGGYNNTGDDNPDTYLTSAELFNTSTGKWSLTSSLTGTIGLPATPGLLTNGDVLIANAAQFYNPTTATWTATGALPTISWPPTKASLLVNGNVLGTGGECKSSKDYNCGGAPTAIAFLYSFSGNSWSETGAMNYPRFSHTMTLLSSGKVLVAGGYYDPERADLSPLAATELYTP